MATKEQKLADSIDEFSERSGLGRSFLYKEIAAGRLRVRKAGRRTIILREDGQDYLAKLPSPVGVRAIGPAND